MFIESKVIFRRKKFAKFLTYQTNTAWVFGGLKHKKGEKGLNVGTPNKGKLHLLHFHRILVQLTVTVKFSILLV